MFTPSPLPDEATDRTLRGLLRAEGALPFDRAAQVLGDVTAELAALHASGRVHGAITPQSIHLDAAGAAHLGPPATDPDAVGLVPPAYLAPERIDRDRADARSDVYGLGLVGWEMLAGETPFAADSLREIVALQQGRDLPRLTTLRPGVPRPLLFAIEGALHKQPSDRWTDAGEMLQQLRQGMPPLRPSVVPLPLRPTAGPTRVRRDRDVPVAAVVGAPRRSAAVGETRWGRRLSLVVLMFAIVGAGLAALVATQGRAKRTASAPWIDSLTTTSSAGLVVTSDTTGDTAARLHANRARPALVAPVPAPAPAPVDSTPAPAVDPAVSRTDSTRPAVADSMPRHGEPPARTDSAPTPIRTDSAPALPLLPTAPATPAVPTRSPDSSTAPKPIKPIEPIVPSTP